VRARRLGEQIKQTRLRKSLKQHELAKLAGVSQPTISRIESGKVANPGAKLIARIANILEIPLNPLLIDGELEYLTNTHTFIVDSNKASEMAKVLEQVAHWLKVDRQRAWVRRICYMEGGCIEVNYY